MEENKTYEKFLPIGTVVMLKGGTKRVMITGYLVTPADDKDKLFDYCGCLFPEGVVSSDKNLLFNHDQIDKVYHLGLRDDEEKAFINQLIAAVNATSNSQTTAEPSSKNN